MTNYAAHFEISTNAQRTCRHSTAGSGVGRAAAIYQGIICRLYWYLRRVPLAWIENQSPEVPIQEMGREPTISRLLAKKSGNSTTNGLFALRFGDGKLP